MSFSGFFEYLTDTQGTGTHAHTGKSLSHKIKKKVSFKESLNMSPLYMVKNDNFIQREQFTNTELSKINLLSQQTNQDRNLVSLQRSD